MKKFNIKVKGEEWEVRFLTRKQYEKLHGEDSEAITLPNKQVHFNRNNFNTVNVRHELLHIFVNESNTESSGLNSEQTEELCASIVGQYGVEIVALADLITNKFLAG